MNEKCVELATETDREMEESRRRDLLKNHDWESEPIEIVDEVLAVLGLEGVEG